MANKKNQKLIWLVGGGTGGHVTPLIALASELKKDSSLKLVYIGERKGLEERMAKENGIPFTSVSSGKLRRYVSVTALFLNIRDVFRILKGIIKCIFLIQKHKPTLVFSKGGSVALPVALAAWLTDTPIVTHESDAVMGLSNRFIAHFAEVIFTGFPASYYPVSLAKKIISVGIPLRPEFCGHRKETKGHQRPTVLVTGGSQGALGINRVVLDSLPHLLKEVDVVHLTGSYSYKECHKARELLPENLKEHYTILEFSSDIVDYMRQADVIVSRASSTIFEIASLGKPMILVPLPLAANNHQVKNAEIFAQHNAAIVIRQESLTSDILYEKIENILRDKTLQLELREGVRNFVSCDASKRVVASLKQFLN